MNKKLKLLFVMESLGIGGAEKSLLTILSMLDYKKYDVDLFLFTHTGEFMNMIPKEVNLLSESKKYRTFYNNRKKSPLLFLKRKDYKSAYYSLKWLIGATFSKITNKKLYIGWNNVKHFFDELEIEYDTSIAFLERKTIYFNIEKVSSKNKIGFIHNDYSIYPYDEKLDRKYFKHYNHLATVSEHCKNVLINIFPEYQEKFLVIKNMVSSELINKLAKEKIQNYKIDKNYINIVSVGRLVEQKGFDIAIEICKKLCDDGLNIRWYIVGEGPEKENLIRKSKKLQIEQNFCLVGADTNPYKWMNIADIYVQTSRFEGYGITVAEAKCLCKPIVASNIPEFVELLLNNRGILCSNINEYVFAIKKIINHYKKYNNIEKKDDSNKPEELKKLIQIL